MAAAPAAVAYTPQGTNTVTIPAKAKMDNSAPAGFAVLRWGPVKDAIGTAYYAAISRVGTSIWVYQAQKAKPVNVADTSPVGPPTVDQLQAALTYYEQTHGIAPAASPVAATTAIPATGYADGQAIAPDASDDYGDPTTPTLAPVGAVTAAPVAATPWAAFMQQAQAYAPQATAAVQNLQQAAAPAQSAPASQPAVASPRAKPAAKKSSNTVLIIGGLAVVAVIGLVIYLKKRKKTA